jgi:hypothetical protein
VSFIVSILVWNLNSSYSWVLLESLTLLENAHIRCPFSETELAYISGPRFCEKILFVCWSFLNRSCEESPQLTISSPPPCQAIGNQPALPLQLEHDGCMRLVASHARDGEIYKEVIDTVEASFWGKGLKKLPIYAIIQKVKAGKLFTDIYNLKKQKHCENPGAHLPLRKTVASPWRILLLPYL